MRTLTFAVAVALASAAFAAPAFAGDIRISTVGRDLSSEAGVAALHAQIERAAKRACGMTARLSARAYQRRAACVSEKVDETVRTANVPALTALHASLKQTTRS
jgi:UrcA family protein